MACRKTTAALFLVICLLAAQTQQCFGLVPQQQDLPALLQQLGSLTPDPCTPAEGRPGPATTADRVPFLFDRVADAVLQQLNEPGDGQPNDRATETLKKLEQLSVEINATWPEENRFHFQILDLSPSALAVKMVFRFDAKFYVLGVSQEDAYRKPSRMWNKEGDGPPPDSFGSHSISLYPLHRGPSGNARFLASIQSTGCAGNTVGISYDAREWNPSRYGGLEQIIKQNAVLDLDDKVTGFPSIGKLQTQGALITLPYCWFSSIDTWDNASLCAVDTYDLSGDQVTFHARRYNRPDLLTIARAIEYAQQHDYRAVLSYCASSQVARHLVRDVPTSVWAEDLHVVATGKGRERVKFSDDGYRFDLEKRAGVWMIVDFKDK
jgi:hypothetical protein